MHDDYCEIFDSRAMLPIMRCLISLFVLLVDLTRVLLDHLLVGSIISNSVYRTASTGLVRILL